MLVGEYLASLAQLRLRSFVGTARLYEQPTATDSLGNFSFQLTMRQRNLNRMGL